VASQSIARRVFGHAFDAVVVRPAIVTIEIALPLSEQVRDGRLKISRQYARFEIRKHPSAHGLKNSGGWPIPLAGLQDMFVRGDIFRVQVMFDQGQYLRFGASPDLSILFVPGFTMPAWIWENQIAHFSVDHRVVAMDLRSQGKSSKTGEGDYPASQARDIKAVIEQLHLEPVVLVGWSMAVTEIASYIDQFGTGNVAGIVLVDGVAGLDLTPEIVKSNIDFLKAMQTNRPQQTSDFVRSIFRKPQSEEYLRKLIKASMGTPTDAVIAMGVAGFSTDNRPALAKINKPTLIVGATLRLMPQFQPCRRAFQARSSNFSTMLGRALCR